MRSWLEQQATRIPDRIALRDGDLAWNFRQLDAEVTRLAAVVRGLPAERVGIVAGNSAQLVTWILAVLTAGRDVVLLNPRLSDPELAEQCRRAACAVVLFADAERSVGRASLSFDAAAQLPGQSGPSASWDDDAIATIMFTSGSTGIPKGVLQTFGNHRASALATVLNLGLDPLVDSWLVATPLHHISGLAIMFRCLLYGIPLVVQRCFDAGESARLLDNGEATIMSVVPQMLRDILTTRGMSSMHPRFRAFLLGGGFSDADLVAQAWQHGIRVIPSYGMSETCSNVLACPPQPPASACGSAGMPLIGVDCRIGDDHEIQLRGPMVCAGYLDDPAAFAARWTNDGWFRTGDQGTVDDHGYVTIKERLSELIISGGENVSPAEVEAVLSTHPAIAQCCVVGAPDSRWGYVPVAFVALRTPTETGELAAFCRERLAKYKVPARFWILDSLPTTALGKIARADLVQLALRQGDL